MNIILWHENTNDVLNSQQSGYIIYYKEENGIIVDDVNWFAAKALVTLQYRGLKHAACGPHVDR